MQRLLTLALLSLVLPLGAETIIVNGTPFEYSGGIEGAVELEFATEIGQWYQVQISPDLSAWDNEGYSIKGTGGIVSTLVSTRNYPSAFFRVTDEGLADNEAPWIYYGASPVVVDPSAKTIGLNPATPGDILRFDGSNWVSVPMPSIEPTVLNNMQPYQVILFAIAMQGIYPSRNSLDPFIGEIMMFGGNFAPRGWTECNGQLLAISQNTALFSLLGTMYGGDGRTTFGVPDLRGRVPIHRGQSPGGSIYDQGAKGGVETTTHAH